MIFISATLLERASGVHSAETEDTQLLQSEAFAFSTQSFCNLVTLGTDPPLRYLQPVMVNAGLLLFLVPFPFPSRRASTSVDRFQRLRGQMETHCDQLEVIMIT
ncbi:hypothetical protein CesoFtcFv8_021470 [Champsocephalus esox]|uniref:Uncharacterized protein n=1 Tax=Champsocephalus esox TaxID=159716 RepID=A0AAN8BEB6_9TELE|nr:hypothetical protein CesoFtcFv8_021468 [Champsocephalus esox]KAK5882931.1 hypothetical protein CesoFtcFv8_021470 [Champsocephalus esox]